MTTELSRAIDRLTKTPWPQARSEFAIRLTLFWYLLGITIGIALTLVVQIAAIVVKG